MKFCPIINKECLTNNCTAFYQTETQDIIHNKILKDGKCVMTISPDYIIYKCKHFDCVLGYDADNEYKKGAEKC